MFCRFDSFRREQSSMAADCLEAIANGRNIICHAPTGIGKTDAALSPALAYAYENEMSVFFLTPKSSQHKIVLEVVNGINSKYKTGFLAVDLVGKKNLCPNENLQGLDSSVFYRTCEDFCMKRLCEYMGNTTSQATWNDKSKQLGQSMIDNKDAVEFNSICGSMGLCSYETTVRMAKNADVIIADYNHVFYPEIFSYILGRSMKYAGNCILIVDEAHNLSRRLSDRMSQKINERSFRFAYSEARKFRQKTLAKAIKNLFFNYRKALQECLGSSKEILISEDFFNFHRDIEKIAEELILQGDMVMLKKRKRSSMHSLGSFLKEWTDEGKFARVGKTRDHELIKSCLDVRPLTGVMNSFHSTICMSGTLKPLEMHSKILGLEDPILKEYSSVFPRENRFVFHAPGYTTRYSKRGEAEYRRIAEKILSVQKSVGEQTVAYFPSFAVLNGVAKELSSLNILSKNPVAVLLQSERMSPHASKELIRRFVDSGELMLCVMGGSFAEGIEFPNNSVKCVVIVGLPLEEMNLEVRERIKHFEKEFGNGMDYGYVVPAMTRIVQSVGRLIRSERDYGVVVFLEDRLAWSNYRKFLGDDLEFIQSIYPEPMIKKFFADKLAEERIRISEETDLHIR